MFKQVILGTLLLTAQTAWAFNVEVYTVGADLVVEGDGDHNSILIEGISNNQVRITPRRAFGFFPTIVNGSTTRSVVMNVTGDLFVSMGGGSDTLEIRDLNLTGGNGRDLNIQMSSGNDELLLNLVFASGNVNVDLGSGHDEQRMLGDLFANEFNVSGGSGNDGIAVDAARANSLTVLGGSGNDSVWAFFLSVGDFVIDLGNGNDDLNLAASRAQNVTLFGGAGDDLLWTPFYMPNNFDAGANSTGFEFHMMF